MSKYYFLTVQTYKSVNKMGEALASYVDKKYDCTIVDVAGFDAVEKDIKEKMAELQKQYPRCRPFRYNCYKTKDRWSNGQEHIYVKPESTYNDNLVFAIRSEHVRNSAMLPKLVKNNENE